MTLILLHSSLPRLSQADAPPIPSATLHQGNSQPTPFLPSPHHLPSTHGCRRLPGVGRARPPPACPSRSWGRRGKPTASMQRKSKHSTQQRFPRAFQNQRRNRTHTPSSPLMTGKLKGQLCPQTCSPPPVLSIQHHTQHHAPSLLQPCRRGCGEVAARVPLPGFTCGRRDISQGDGGSRRRVPGRTQPRVPTAGWHVPLSSRGATGQGAASPRGLFRGAL